MKALRLLGLSAVLALAFASQVKPVLAACRPCTTNAQCVSCTGEPDAVCLGHICAF
jgi:hypothetical protein